MLLFLFACATFGFVAFVWLQPDTEPPPTVVRVDTPTLPPGVVPCCPVVTTTAP